MPESYLDADTIGIGELIQIRRLLRVPDHQREFAWRPDEEVEEFVTDIRTALDDGDPDYFLGLIVLVKPGDDNAWEILDGQQRLATTTMVYAAIREWLNAAGLEKDAQKIQDDFACFHLQHLPRMTARPEHTEQLRETILDLAARGKLTPQDPDDAPAVDLLIQIASKQIELGSQTGAKKPLPAVVPDEIPFGTPSGWVVARMGSLAEKLGAGSTPLGGKSVYQSSGVPFLRSQNVYNNGLRLDDVALVARATHDRMSGTHVQPGDVLLNITGASIGRCALVPDNFVEGNVSQHVAIIRLFIPAIREFIHLSLMSPFFQKMIHDVEVGVSREGLSMRSLRMFPMLLPPLAEQHRIVAKVDELMALCDRLETQLTTGQTESRRLLEALLHEALGEAA